MQSFRLIRMLLSYLVFQLVIVTARTSVVFEDCGSAYDLHTVNIKGCGMRLPCFVTLGDRIPVNVRFFADFVSSQLDQDVTIQINFVQSRTPVTPEPCETVMCPVRTDAETSFTSVMSVPTNMALNQRGYLQWRVYNEMGKRVLCYQVMVQTQNYLQKILRRYLTVLDTKIDGLGLPFSGNTFSRRLLNSTILLSKLRR
ncbi:uncharacterized protein LOC120631872 [Pararge aegeria]|uniref:uncharacterized protein LOC120631872 n=1 Tax=Pararge aegeria TaxID=116150 RepID=UPI0019D212DB|nr:uncharacterized protein LOC120631872 [Pararge aegeria]